MKKSTGVIVFGALLLMLSLGAAGGGLLHNLEFRSAKKLTGGPVQGLREYDSVVIQGTISDENPVLAEDMVLANEYEGTTLKTRRFRKSYVQPLVVDMKQGKAVVRFEKDAPNNGSRPVPCALRHEDVKQDKKITYNGNRRGDLILVTGSLLSADPLEVAPEECNYETIEQHEVYLRANMQKGLIMGAVLLAAGIGLILLGRKLEG